MRKHRASVFLSFAFALSFSSAQAETDPNALFDSVSLYNGQGVDLNLREVPGAILTGDWNRESSYFTGVGLGKKRGTLGDSIDALRSTPFAAVSHGYEVIWLQHRGLQGNAELAAAYLLRTPDLELGPLGVNFATGIGLSHAFGTPTYEDGPRGNPSRRYRTQFLALYELEWRYLPAPKLSLVTRIHHRSGIYGFVAPRHVGSNFASVGLRYRF